MYHLIQKVMERKHVIKKWKAIHFSLNQDYNKNFQNHYYHSKILINDINIFAKINNYYDSFNYSNGDVDYQFKVLILALLIYEISVYWMNLVALLVE